MRFSNERSELIDVALGKALPTLVIRGGHLLNVHSGEIYPADIFIQGSRIAVVDRDFPLPEGNFSVINAEGQTIVPGFIDPHIHLESSAVVLSEYVKTVVPRGTTAVVEDPHEIANVLGMEGIKLFFQESKGLPINLMLRVPGKVPGVGPELETSSGEISLEETRELLDWDEAVCLAGDINPNLLLNKDEDQLEKIAYTMHLKKTVSGQSPGLSKGALNAFVSAGPEDSHVSENVDEILDIVRHGMRALITHREDFFKYTDYQHLAEMISNKKMDTRLLCFCSDDVQPHVLLERGGLDDRVRLAIHHGVNPVTAIQMATINTATFLRIDRDFGSVTPGKFADIVILDDLKTLKVDKVIYHGKVVAEKGLLIHQLPSYTYPEWAKNTMHVQRSVNANDFPIQTPEKDGEVNVRVIQFGMPKMEKSQRLRVKDGIIMPDSDLDILSIAVLDRHKHTGNIGKGFVTGIGIHNGAIASSVSHDAHNIFVVGSGFEAMAIATNQLILNGGGHVAVHGKKVVAQVELPIAGLMSEQPIEVVAAKFNVFEQVLKEELGCKLNHPLYFINFICLPNIPHLGITDKGLINTDTMKIIDTIIR